jgi:plastocyanin
MTPFRGSVLAAAIVVAFLGFACGGDNDSPSTTPTAGTGARTPTPGSSAAAGGRGSTVQLRASNLAFDKRDIEIAGGASVSVEFDNQDTLPHNFAVYTTREATTKVFVGDIVNGQTKTTYQFAAPAPGAYFFRCDVHPDQMTGELTVT